MKIRIGPKWRLAGILATTIVLLGHGIGGAGAQPEPADQPKIDPKADQVVRAVSDYYKGLQSFSVDYALTVNSQAGGEKEEITIPFRIAMQRPNRFAMVLKEGENGVTVVTDGEKLFAYVPGLNEYTVADAPASLEKLFTEHPETAMVLSRAPGGDLVSSLVRDDPYKHIMKDVEAVSYVGLEGAEANKLHRLAFDREPLDADMWIHAGEKPLIGKVVPDTSEMVKQMQQQSPEGMEVKLELVQVFANWSPNVPLSAKDFKFTPPQGAEKVETFFRDRSAERTQQLLGKPAPAFELDVLGGGKFDLAAHKGRNVVVLDFWASWCGPCRRGLPELQSVAKTYAEKGVTFCAVNVQEAPEDAEKFVEEIGLQLTVALDRTGKVANLYAVSGIPQTVVIGRDGMVQAIHVGFSPGLGQRLAGELDKLLAGESLVQPKAEEEPAKPAP